MTSSTKNGGGTPPPLFRGFNPYGPLRIYDHGLLPHWRQPGCTYFVTFRLADSLPKSIVADWKAERNEWLEDHGIDPSSPDWRCKLKELTKNLVKEFETRFGERLDRFLDAGHGSCLLKKPENGKLVANALTHFQGERVLTGDLVVMPNHVHALMRPLKDFELEDLLHSVKSFTAHRINETETDTGAVWQKESYDRIVRDFRELRQFQKYIHANPQKAGLKAGQYMISDEVSYEQE